MRHEHDPRIAASRPQALWHADPNFEAVMRDLLAQTRPARIVETGTHMGWTADWFARELPSTPLHTVELDPDYHRLSKENLAEHANVECHLGSSPEFLASTFPWLLCDLTFFWLDAHWWQPVPLREECRIISENLDRYVVVVDDFECRDPDFEGDGGEATFGFKMCNLAYVAEWLGPRCWRPNYPAKPGAKGYGIFCRGVEYRPHALVKLDTL